MYLDNFDFLSDLTPKRTGLNVTIWSNHGGILNKLEYIPFVKIGERNGFNVTVTITSSPKILDMYRSIGELEMLDIEEAIKYIGRNYDLFLKHFNDVDDSFDDDDLKTELSKRGDYKV